jgi:hypothetical protein
MLYFHKFIYSALSLQVVLCVCDDLPGREPSDGGSDPGLYVSGLLPEAVQGRLGNRRLFPELSRPHLFGHAKRLAALRSHGTAARGRQG